MSKKIPILYIKQVPPTWKIFNIVILKMMNNCAGYDLVCIGKINFEIEDVN